MGVNYDLEVEKIFLQGKLGGDTRSSMHDLRLDYYHSQGVPTNIQSITDAERMYLQGKLGVTKVQSLHDLRVMYAQSLGISYQVDSQEMVDIEYEQNLAGGA